MKRLLLITALVLSAATLSAQSLSTKKSGSSVTTHKAQSAIRPEMRQQTRLQEVEAPHLVQKMEKRTAKKISGKRLKVGNFTPAKAGSLAPHKTVSLLESYEATGYDMLKSNADLSWTMYPSQFDESTPCLVDVIPTPFSSSIGVEYTLDEEANTITIPYQLIGIASDSIHIYFMNYNNNEDGSATLTVDSKGYPQVAAGDIFCYVAYVARTNEESGEQEFEHAGYFQAVSDISYGGDTHVEGAPYAWIEPEGLYLHAGCASDGYSYGANLSVIPCYSPVVFNNYSVDGTDFAWSVDSYEYDATAQEYVTDETQVGTTSDNFTFQTTHGVYGPVTLTASNDHGSDSYTWGTHFGNKEKLYAYAGEMHEDFKMSSGSLAMLTRADLDRKIAYYSFLSTPEENESGWNIDWLACYQGKPSAPLYCEGISVAMYNFECEDINNTGLVCKLYKASRNADGSLMLGDLIAESSTVELESDYYTFLHFKNFKTYDKYGTVSTPEYMFLEDEFAIVLEGYNSGNFANNGIWGDYNCNEEGGINIFFHDANDDNTYRIRYRGWLCFGFDAACYGFLHTEDDTNIVLPVKGGSAEINVYPFLNEEDSNGNPTTMLWLENELPDWLDITIASEDYSGANWGFTLEVSADALEEGETGRWAVVNLAQKGGRLKLLVTQGDSECVQAVVYYGDDNAHKMTLQPDEFAALQLPENALAFVDRLMDTEDLPTNVVVRNENNKWVANNIELTDALPLYVPVDARAAHISYRRTFGSTDWDGLFLPFGMDADDWGDKAEIAYLNTLHQFDEDGDGEVDKTVLEYISVKNGSISANVPYIISPRLEGAAKLNVDNAVLAATPEHAAIDCSSTTQLYTFVGTYQTVGDLSANGFYSFIGNQFVQNTLANEQIVPFRFYMTVTNRDGSPVKGVSRPTNVRIMVDGVEMEISATGVAPVTADGASQGCYDLSGRRIANPSNGFYIVGGKKMIVK